MEKEYNDLSKKEILSILHNNFEVLRKKYFVDKIGIFGSFVHGEADKNSDIDIIVRFYKPIGWDFVMLKEYLEKLFQRQIDIVTENALKPQLRKQILQEVEYL